MRETNKILPGMEAQFARLQSFSFSHCQVYHCRDAQETQQNMEYFLHGTTFLAILGDPVVCFADAQFYQTQVSTPVSFSLTNIRTNTLKKKEYRKFLWIYFFIFFDVNVMNATLQ